jgi:hypothetical protein
VKTQADWTRLSTGKLLKELAKCEKDLQLQLQAPPDVSEEQFSAFLARHAWEYARAGVDIANASPLMLMALREQAKREQTLAQIYARAGVDIANASPLMLMALRDQGTPEQKQNLQLLEQNLQLLTKIDAIERERARRAARMPGSAAQPSNSTHPRAMVKAYIEEVRRTTGKRITKKDIWTEAGYKTRTEFERWERQDLKHPNKAAAEVFTRILCVEKSHLK